MLSHFSHVQLFETVARQAPLSMEFSRQEYWSMLPFHSPGHLPNPGIKHSSPASPASAGGFFTREPPGKPVCTFRDPKALQSLKNLRNDVTSGRGVPGPGAATVSVNIGREVGSRRPLLCGPDGFVSFSLLVAELLGNNRNYCSCPSFLGICELPGGRAFPKFFVKYHPTFWRRK